MKILLHFIGYLESEDDRSREISINDACHCLLLEEERLVLDGCGVTMAVATGKKEKRESFIDMLALPAKSGKQGKFDFRIRILSPYYWCTWVESEGDDMPRHSQYGYGFARFWWDGNSMEIEMRHNTFSMW